MTQGLQRWYNGNSRNDVAVYREEIKKFINWNSRVSDVGVLMRLAAIGMKRLIQTYKETTIVSELDNCYTLLCYENVSPLINAKQKYTYHDISTIISLLHLIINTNDVTKKAKLIQIVLEISLLC